MGASGPTGSGDFAMNSGLGGFAPQGVGMRDARGTVHLIGRKEA
jgi:hypothetical protein